MIMQNIIIGIIIAAAIIYAGYRVFVAIRSAGDPCYGCSGCALHEQMLKKQGKKKKKPLCFNKK
jgi:hypothetical protein